MPERGPPVSGVDLMTVFTERVRVAPGPASTVASALMVRPSREKETERTRRAMMWALPS